MFGNNTTISEVFASGGGPEQWGSFSSFADLSYESLDDIFNILPIIKVVEHNGIINVSGFWARSIAKDIQRTWKSARVTNNIFIDLNARSFTCHSFFALEIIHVLETLMEDPKSQTDRMTLQQIRDEMLAKTWLRNIEEAEPIPINRKNLKRLTVDPLESQSNFLDALSEKRNQYLLDGHLMASPPGTGKTLAGFMTSLVLEADLTLFVVPNNSLHEVWEDTAIDKFKKRPDFWLSDSGTMPTGKEEFWFCHFQFLVKLMPLIEKMRKKKRFCIWIDESHNFNEITADRTLALIDIVKKTEPYNTVWASGTPLKAFGAECVPILRTIAPQFTPEAEKAFLDVFGRTKGRAIDILTRRIGAISYKVPKSNVVNNVVRTIEKKVKIKNPERFLLTTVRADIREYVKERAVFYKDNRKAYLEKWEFLYANFKLGSRALYLSEKKMFDSYEAQVRKMYKAFNQKDDRELIKNCKDIEKRYILPALDNASRKEYRHVVAVVKYTVLVIRGEALGRILVRRRIECFQAMIEAANLQAIVKQAPAKTLIFSSFVPVVNGIAKEMNDFGMEPAIITGETNNEFEKVMGSFRTDPRRNPAIATYKSLSTAVPVTEASDVVLFDPPVRDYIRDQAVSRLDRYGQKNRVTIWEILLDTGEDLNLSTRSKEILEQVKELVDRMMGIDSSKLPEDV